MENSKIGKDLWMQSDYKNSFDLAHIALSIDSSCSKNTDKYYKSNLLQYRIAIACWSALAASYSPRLRTVLQSVIRSEGLLGSIALADEYADAIIRGDQLPNTNFIPAITDYGIADILQYLRFLVRFSPVGNDVAEKNAVDKFKSVNRCCRITGSQGYPLWLLSSVQVHTRRLLRYTEAGYKKSLPQFSAGSSMDGRTLHDKLTSYAQYQKWWADPMYPLVSTDGRNRNIDNECIVVKGVDKSYKTKRLIAPELPFFLAEKHRMRKAIRYSLTRTMPVNPNGTLMYQWDDQRTSQSFAQIGSMTGQYATIDLSSASDSYSEFLAAQVLPDFIWKFHTVYNYNWMSIGNQTLRKGMFATSGDPICFDLESTLFLSVCLAARDYLTLYDGKQETFIRVFGDDIVVSTNLAPIVVEFLGMLGFTVNSRKTWLTGPYREACGGEYYDGVDISSTYWPRRPIDSSPEGIIALASLQQRMYRYHDIDIILSDIIRDLHPAMTSSLPGTECSDMWSDYPEYGKRCAPLVPGTVISDPSITLREAHTILSAGIPQPGWDANVDMYHYVNFLANGPSYEDSLMELLGVSTPLSRDADFGTKPAKLRKVVR